MNRKVASAKTAASGIILNIVTAVFGFVSQKIFIDNLGIEYSGINGVFTSIISILTLADLGVSTAVIFHLYKPLANKNELKVAALLQYYRKACWIIGGVIIVGGLFMLPFARNFVGETSVPDNLYIIFALLILNASLTYISNYRRPLLAADQKGFITNSVMTGSVIALYAFRIMVLITTKNFYLYTLLSVISRFCENFIIGKIVGRKYPYISERAELDSATKKDIKKKIQGSVYHNAASYVVFSTTNLIISQLFNVIQVGLYANYYMVINSLNLLLGQLFSAMTASLGNILASEGLQRLYMMTKRLMLLNFWVYATVAVAAYYCLTPFIKLWIGPEYLFPDIVVVLLILSFYLQGMRGSIGGVLSAAGIIHENRFVPVFEAIINLGSSIILGLWLGLPGVFMGVVLSNLFLHLYSFPKYAFKLVLKRKSAEYLLLFAKYLGLFITSWIGVGGIIQFINIDSNILSFFVKGIISIIVPSVAYFFIFRKSEEFKYFRDLIMGVIRKKLQREK